MGVRADKKDEIIQGSSANDTYIHPHNIRLSIQIQGEIEEEVEDDSQTVHYVGGFEIPPSLQISPDRQMAWEDQIRMQTRILHQLSKFPEIYSPPCTKPDPVIEPEPISQPLPLKDNNSQYYADPSWRFGQGHIVDTPLNMAQTLWERKYGDRNGLERHHPLVLPPIQEAQQMMQRLSIPRHSIATNWRSRAPASHAEGIIDGRVSKRRSSPPKK